MWCNHGNINTNTSKEHTHAYTHNTVLFMRREVINRKSSQWRLEDYHYDNSHHYGDMCLSTKLLYYKQ